MFSCVCGSQVFHINAGAVFDYEEFEELDQIITSNEFGWFSVATVCQACAHEYSPIDYETA